MEVILEGKGAGRRVSNLRIINHALNLSPLQISSLSQNKRVGTQICPGWRGGREGGSSVYEGRTCEAEKLEKESQDVRACGCGAPLITRDSSRTEKLRPSQWHESTGRVYQCVTWSRC